MTSGYISTEIIGNLDEKSFSGVAEVKDQCLKVNEIMNKQRNSTVDGRGVMKKICIYFKMEDIMYVYESDPVKVKNG